MPMALLASEAIAKTMTSFQNNAAVIVPSAVAERSRSPAEASLSCAAAADRSGLESGMPGMQPLPQNFWLPLHGNQ
jgi:hypothetical protein